MSLIRTTDPDFKVCVVEFEALILLQQEAERLAFATRWSSVDALAAQVKVGTVLLHAFLREERAGEVRAYRCFVLFAATEGDTAGGVSTLDVSPATYAALDQIDHDPIVRSAFVRVFTLASGGIAMVSKG